MDHGEIHWALCEQGVGERVVVEVDKKLVRAERVGWVVATGAHEVARVHGAQLVHTFHGLIVGTEVVRVHDRVHHHGAFDQRLSSTWTAGTDVLGLYKRLFGTIPWAGDPWISSSRTSRGFGTRPSNCSWTRRSAGSTRGTTTRV